MRHISIRGDWFDSNLIQIAQHGNTKEKVEYAKLKKKKKDKKLAVCLATGAMTVMQGRNSVWFIFVFLQYLAVCLAHSQGPFVGRNKKTTLQMQFILSLHCFDNE